MATSSELYISWNNALVDYFISTSTSTVFYVTDSKIEDIGKKYNIEKDEEESYKDCFVRAISFFIEKSNSAKGNLRGRIRYTTLKSGLFSILRIEGYTTPTTINDLEDLLETQFGNNKATLLDLAIFLTEHTIFLDVSSKTKLEFAYFSYVIFILLGFNNSEDRTWKGVEEKFKSNKIYFSNNERGKVASLFKTLIDNNVLTSLCVQTQDPYMKYLKYHSVLRPMDRSLFEDILYENHIQWDCNMVYGDLRNLIWRVGIKNTGKYTKLREELRKASTRPYFESLIKEFNREQYALNRSSEVSAGNNTIVKRGKFRFVVDYRSLSTQIWLQYLQPDRAVSNNDITLTHIHTYADNCRVDMNNSVLWTDYVSNGLKYQDSDYFVDSTRSSDFYFFEIIEGVLLAEMVEPEQLVGKACFLVIRNNSKNRQYIINYHKAQPIDISRLPVFGNGWDVYYIPQYEPKQMEINISDSQETQELRYAQICFDNCITIDKKYLLEAFPYIVTEGINDPLQEVGILILDIYGQNVGFKKKSVGNRIYLYDFDTVPCGEIKVTITVDRIEESRSFRVICNTQVAPAINKHCARFDKWGCLNNSLQNEYYSDNQITSAKSNQAQISDIPSIPNYNKEDKQPYHRLMAILYSIGNSANKYRFTSKDLDNILIYLAGFDGDNLTEWEIKKIKYTLRDLGIVTHYYENGKYLYETNTPRLTPLKEGRHIFNGKNEQVIGERMLYLLYGTYSQVMYDYLYTTVDHFEYKSLILSSNNSKLNKYIPSYIVVGLSTNQNLDTIQVCSTSFVDELLLFAGKVSELDQDKVAFKTRNFNDDTSYSYPVMVASPYNRGRKELLRLSPNDILDNDNLSPDLLRTYVRYKHNEPVWCVDRGLQQTELYFKSDWQLPFYVRKALVAQNSALPKDNLYAFGIDDILGADSKEHLFCKMYMYECAQQYKKDVLGDIIHKQVEIVTTKGLKMIAIKSTENGLNNWHLELKMNGKLRCYTQHDKSSKKVFYVNDNKQVEVVSNKERCNTINAKLSAVLNLIIYCSTSKFDENEWVNEFLILAHNKADIPKLNSGEKHEVKIIMPSTIKRKH